MMRREQIIGSSVQDQCWRDMMMFMNNPCKMANMAETMCKLMSPSMEHHRHGKKHMFRRSMMMNGKMDMMEAMYDGEKTIVKYDNCKKEVTMPGLLDITCEMMKKTEKNMDLCNRMEAMNQMMNCDEDMMRQGTKSNMVKEDMMKESMMMAQPGMKKGQPGMTG